MKKHTPGPWHEGAGNGEGSIFADHGRMRYEDGHGTCLYPIAEVNRGFDKEEDEANSRLIAAAPELLQACESILKWGYASKDDENVWTRDRVIAAVQKALGEVNS